MPIIDHIVAGCHITFKAFTKRHTTFILASFVNAVLDNVVPLLEWQEKPFALFTYGNKAIPKLLKHRVCTVLPSFMVFGIAKFVNLIIKLFID
jgi:hypothetical protein